MEHQTPQPSRKPAAVPIRVGWRFRLAALGTAMPTTFLAFIFGTIAAVAFAHENPGVAGIVIPITALFAWPAIPRLRRVFARRAVLTVHADRLVVDHPGILRAPVTLRRDEVRAVAVDTTPVRNGRFPVRRDFDFTAPGETQEQLGSLFTMEGHYRRCAFPAIAANGQDPNTVIVLERPRTLTPQRSWMSVRSSKAPFGELRAPTIAFLVDAEDVTVLRAAFREWDVVRGLVASDFGPRATPPQEVTGTTPPPLAAALPKEAGSLRSRTVVAVLLAFGFYLLGMLVAVGSIAGAIALVASDTGYLAAIALGFLGVNIGWSLLPRPLRIPKFGHAVGPGTQPRLWTLVRQVAEAADERAPDEIRIVAEVNAHVHETGGPRNRRVLAVGLPLFAAMTERELAAIIAHELGHFKGGDTKLGRLAGRTDRAIVHTIQRMTSGSWWLNGLMGLVFVRYYRLFIRLTHGTKRRQEFAADAVSAAVAGSEPAIAALRRVHAAAHAFDWFWNGEMGPALSAGARPTLMAGFATFLRQRKVADAMSDVLADLLANERDDPYDTHPPLRDRIAAIEKIGIHSGDGSPSATGLLDTVDRIELEILAENFGSEAVGNVKRSSWDDMVERVHLPVWREQVWRVRDGLDGVTVADLPEIAVDPARFAGMIGADDVRELDADHAKRGTVWTLGVALCVTLADAGFTLTGDPGGPVIAVRGTARLRPFDAVEAMAEGRADADGWRRRCAAEHVAGLPLNEGGIEPNPEELQELVAIEPVGVA